MENDVKIMTKESYRQKIIEMIEGIKSAGTLEYLYEFIRLFLEKWG